MRSALGLVPFRIPAEAGSDHNGRPSRSLPKSIADAVDVALVGKLLAVQEHFNDLVVGTSGAASGSWTTSRPYGS